MGSRASPISCQLRSPEIDETAAQPFVLKTKAADLIAHSAGTPKASAHPAQWRLAAGRRANSVAPSAHSASSKPAKTQMGQGR